MLGNRVAVQSLSKSRKNDGLIKMLDDSHNTGKVMYVGPECESIEVGQVICFGNQREPVKVNGEDLIVMETTNIYGILDGEEVKNK